MSEDQYWRGEFLRLRSQSEAETIQGTSPGPSDATACSARWTLLFAVKGKDGSVHPLRVEFSKSVNKAHAVRYAFKYLEENDWLELLEDAYPTEEQKS
jgi:hypothetical protein